MEISMAIHDLNTRFTTGRNAPAPRAYFAFGVWLRAGFVALSVAAIALMMLAEGQASPWAGGASVIAGVGIAALAWRRAWVLIERLEPVEPRAADTASAQPRRARFAPVESAASR